MLLQLSPELYHQIALKFRSSENPKNDHDSMGVFHGYEVLRNLGQSQGVPDLPALLNLRLTSKAFYNAATRVLFRSCRVQWQPSNSHEYNNYRLANLNASISNSLLSMDDFLWSTIRKLQVDFSAGVWHSCFRPLDDSADLERKKEDSPRLLVERLPQVLKKLSNLESFELYMTGWKSDFDGGENSGFAPRLDLPFLAGLTLMLAENLGTSSNFEHLTELRLSLPCTHDFVELSNAIQDTTLDQLKHLLLGITDATGPGGSKDYLIWAAEDDDGDRGFPFSNLQERYSNTEYISGIFDIVARCHNLESLALYGTQFLDGNILNWRPSSLGLKQLYLARVKTSQKNLIKLLSPAESFHIKSSAISGLWFEQVDLTTGTWSEVFTHLQGCPSLSYFNTEDLSYARGGDSFHLKDFWTRRLWEDSQNLWSLHDPDEETLETLVASLLRRAVMRSESPSLSEG